jgi:hypothetical protein
MAAIPLGINLVQLSSNVAELRLFCNVIFMVSQTPGITNRSTTIDKRRSKMHRNLTSQKQKAAGLLHARCPERRLIIANILGALLGILFSVVATASLKPTSVLAFILIALWTAAPFMGVLIFSRAHKNIRGMGIGIFLSLGIGVLSFIDVRYWHPDAQGGIVFLFLPIIFVAVITGSIAIDKKHNMSDSFFSKR